MTLTVTPANPDNEQQEKPPMHLFFYCDMNGDLRVAKTDDATLVSHYVGDSEFIVVRLTPDGPMQVTESGLSEIEAAEAPEDDLTGDEEDD